MNEHEKDTVEKMIYIYCLHKHKTHGALCPECKELNDYAHLRLDKCTFGEDKPTCEKCPIHCYKPIMKEKVREVMKYAGPRMILYHPILAVRHLVKNAFKQRNNIKKQKPSNS